MWLTHSVLFTRWDQQWTACPAMPPMYFFGLIRSARFSPLAGESSVTARTPTCSCRPGTGIPRARGAILRGRDTSPATRLHERKDPPLLWLFPPSSGLHPERRNRVRRFLAPRRWRSAIVLEEQSLSHKRIHGRGRFSASAMGGDRSRQERRHQRDSHRLGRAPRSSLRSAVLAWRRRRDG